MAEFYLLHLQHQWVNDLVCYTSSSSSSTICCHCVVDVVAADVPSQDIDRDCFWTSRTELSQLGKGFLGKQVWQICHH